LLIKWLSCYATYCTYLSPLPPTYVPGHLSPCLLLWPPQPLPPSLPTSSSAASPSASASLLLALLCYIHVSTLLVYRDLCLFLCGVCVSRMAVCFHSAPYSGRYVRESEGDPIRLYLSHTRDFIVLISSYFFVLL